MKRHGEVFELNMNLMDDELREQVHREMDPDFEDLLHQKFGIEL